MAKKWNIKVGSQLTIVADVTRLDEDTVTVQLPSGRLETMRRDSDGIVGVTNEPKPRRYSPLRDQPD